MNRALMAALLSVGLVVGDAVAQAQSAAKAATVNVAAVQADVRFQPVRGAIRIDSVNVP